MKKARLIYMLEIRDSFPASFFVRYNHRMSPSATLLDEACSGISALHFSSDGGLLTEGSELDLIDSDHGTYEILSDRFVLLVKQYALHDVKVVDVVLNGLMIRGYKAIITLPIIDCVDYSRSEFQWVKYGELEKVRIDRYAFFGRSLGSHHMVRSAVLMREGLLPGPVVFSPDLGKAMQELKPRGFRMIACDTHWDEIQKQVEQESE